MDFNRDFETFKPGGMFKQEAPPPKEESMFKEPPKNFISNDGQRYSFRPINFYKLDIGELVRK